MATACDNAGVRWEAPQAALGDTLGALSIDAGAVKFVRATVAMGPADLLACAGTVATATDQTMAYATWFRRRPDSSVAVMASRSDDGGSKWTVPAIVDSVDVGQFGCARPGPSIAAAEGYVHVAYSLKAPEGYGVFFAHSMDGGATFHAPMIVVYGDRLSATATAAHGARVAVAYEDPSGNNRRLDVALSRTQGHTFEPRERASPEEMPATHPRIAIRDTGVVLSFAGTDTTGRALRIGRIRR